MIKKGDMFKYTTSIGGSTIYCVEDIYPSITNTSYNNDMVCISWENGDGTVSNSLQPIKLLMSSYISGHIKFVNGGIMKKLRPHTLNVRPRDLPFIDYDNLNPYIKPKLFSWSEPFFSPENFTGV